MLLDPSSIWLCFGCDAVIKKFPLKSGDKAHCPHCGYVVSENSQYSIWWPSVISLLGFLLLLPACYLPLMHMVFWTGELKNHSIFTGVSDFLSQNMVFPAFFVLLGTFMIPFITLLLSLLITVPIALNYRVNGFIRLFKTFYYIRYWSMLEVYLLGIIVSLIKLDTISKVSADMGLIALISLMVCQFMVCMMLKPAWLWNQIESRFPANGLLK